MPSATPTWMNQGAGQAPDSVLTFRPEATITAFSGMLEGGDFVFADQLGTLYRLDSLLNVTTLTRLQDPARLLAWSAVGKRGIAVVGNSTLLGLSDKLKMDWSVDLPFVCSAIAIDPYGQYIFAADADGGGLLVNERGKKIAPVTTLRPLAHVEFLVEEPVFFGAAEHGLLGAYSLNGKPMWEETLWSNVGDLSLIQSSGKVALASLNHGLHIYNANGESTATLVLDGTVQRIACSYNGKVMYAGTVENKLYRLDNSGHLLWAAEADQPALGLFAHPLGQSAVICQELAALRLAW